MIYISCFSQEYWESIYNSEEEIYNIIINSDNDIFLSVPIGLYRSPNLGFTWDLIFSEGGRNIDIDLNNNIYCSPSPIYYSSDNGNNWEALNYPELGVSTIFVNSENFIFVGFWGGIYKSDNNDADWNLVLSLSGNEVVNSIVENSEGILFAGTIDFIGLGGVYISTDQGNNWAHIGLENEYLSALAINSNDDIFAGSRGHNTQYNGGVLRSSDNGETWIDLYTNVLVTSIAIDSEDKIYIGCSNLNGAPGAVHVSDDNGESWSIIESDIMPTTTGIEFITISEDDYVYAISYGGPMNNVYRSIQQTTGTENLLINNRIDYKLYNYPNPFHNQTKIFFDLPLYVNNPIIEIFNIKGQKIRTFNHEIQMSIIWDGRDNHRNKVLSGVYFYQIKDNNRVLTTKKMILK